MACKKYLSALGKLVLLGSFLVWPGMEAKAQTNPPPTVTLTMDFMDMPLFESLGGGANVYFERDGGVTEPLTVYYAISGTAKNGVDYQPLSTAVVIPAGATSVQMTVSAINDNLPERPEYVTLQLASPTDPFTLVVLPDTQYYTANVLGGTPQMFTSQTQWVVDHRDDKNILFLMHEGDCTDHNTLDQWQRVKASMSLLDGVVPYAIAVGNHDGLMTSLRQTDLFNQFFAMTNYQNLPTFGGVFESNRMDNCYHFFRGGGVDWLVLSLEFGPRDEVLAWANQVAASFPNRRIIIVTHNHVHDDETLNGSSPIHRGTPQSYGRRNHGGEVWDKLVRRHANMAFVFNGHIIGDGQGRVVGIGDHGNRVYQMLCNYQGRANGGAGFLRYLTFYPTEDRLEAKSYSPFLNRSYTDPQNEFECRNLGIFSNPPPAYLIDPNQNAVSVGIFSDEIDTAPPEILSVTAFGDPAEITVSFNEPLEISSAETVANYHMNSPVPIVGASLLSDQQTVVLTCQTSLVSLASYILTVENIRDTSPYEHTITNPASRSFVYSPVLLKENFTIFNLDGWTMMDEGTNDAPSIWTIVNGRMFQYANIHSSTSDGSRPGTYALWDKLRAFSWSNYVTSVTLKNGDDDGIGLLFRYQNEANYYKLDFDAEHAFRRLTKMVEGVETELAFASGPFPVNRDVPLRVTVNGPEITVDMDGAMLFGGPIADDAFANGTIALFCSGSSGATFDNLLVMASNAVPQVSISAPAEQSEFAYGTSITCTAQASDADSPIAKVEFFVNNLLIWTRTNAPYDFIWTNAPAGHHSAIARVTDAFDAVDNSPPVHFQVGAAPPRFLRQPEDRIVHLNQSTFFQAQVSSTAPLRYQWLFNGQPITNANTSVLLFQQVAGNQAGTYTLRVESPDVVVLSSPATLEILPEDPPNPPAVPILYLEKSDFMLQPVFSVAGPLGRWDIQFSTNLQTWWPLETLTNTSGRLFFDDPAPSQQRRFYRAISPP